jgi:hypothetical protein
MKTRLPLIAVSVLALAAVAVAQDTAKDTAQDTETDGLVTVLCTGAVALDPPTKQASRIKVGSATREDVTRLLGKPWRTTNDADCDDTQYGIVWEYLFKDANGAFFRVHVAFSNGGKVSLVARIPQRGQSVVLAYAADKEHQH